MKKYKSLLTLPALYSRQSGQALVIVMIVMGLIIVNTLLIITGSVTYLQSTKYDVEKTQVTNLAEAGIDKAVASLNATGGAYNGESETSLGDGSYSISITPIDSSTSIIQSTGYIPNKAKPVATKTIKIQVSKGNGISFSYGVLVGQGGLNLSGGSRINGTVYSNGNIDLSGGGVINGNAYVAGGTQPTANQQSDCTLSCQDFLVGKAVAGSNQYDVAQSFRPSTTGLLNRVSLKLKKIGSPPNPTVKILGDSAGKPNKSQVLGTGTLNGSLVTGQYGFSDVIFSPLPSLTSGTTYWVMIVTSDLSAYDRNNNYWSWNGDILPNWGFKWSPNWQQNPTPTWNTPNPQGDLSFQTWMGGVATHIAGSGSSNITGSAYANTLSGDNPSALQIAQQAYYQSVDTNVKVSNQSCLNPNCHPNSIDPAPLPLPISDANITDWKTLALAQGTTNGNQNIGQPCTAILKGYYSGNVSISNGCSGTQTIKMKTPVYIAGNFSMSGGAVLKLDPVYGAASGVIVVDGPVNLSGGTNVMGTGDPNSLMLVLSTYPSPAGAAAITTGGGNLSSVLYANNGNINISGGGSLYEVVAQKLVITGGGTVNYQSGVPVPQLPSGPSGSFSVIKGSYQIK